MEDIVTIVWILVVAGIAVSNLVSKSRKARGKEQQPHGEAWPSTGEEPMSPAQPEIPEIFGLPRRTPQKNTPQQVGQQPGEGRTPGQSAATAAQPTTGHTPGRHRAYEARTAQKNAPGREGPTAALHTIEAQNSPHKAATITDTKKAQEERVTILGEEFDLRKAVIYSEILKPKFEE